MPTDRFGRKIKLRAIAIKHQIRMRGWLSMTSRSLRLWEGLKYLADKIITSSTPSRLGGSTWCRAAYSRNASRARRSCGRSPCLTNE